MRAVGKITVIIACLLALFMLAGCTVNININENTTAADGESTVADTTAEAEAEWDTTADDFSGTVSDTADLMVLVN